MAIYKCPTCGRGCNRKSGCYIHHQINEAAMAGRKEIEKLKKAKPIESPKIEPPKIEPVVELPPLEIKIFDNDKATKALARKAKPRFSFNPSASLVLDDMPIKVVTVVEEESSSEEEVDSSSESDEDIMIIKQADTSSSEDESESEDSDEESDEESD